MYTDTSYTAVCNYNNVDNEYDLRRSNVCEAVGLQSSSFRQQLFSEKHAALTRIINVFVTNLIMELFGESMLFLKDPQKLLEQFHNN